MTSVSVCGVLYRVEYPKLAPTLHGECDSDRKVIRIRKDLSDEGYLATLVHEVAHAAIEGGSGDAVDGAAAPTGLKGSGAGG